MQHLGHALERWPEVADLVTTAAAAGEWIWDDAEARFRPLEAR
jgi:hypothetical protein